MHAQRRLLPEPAAVPGQPTAGPRWHVQHGPIDLVLVADGEPGAVQQAHEAAWTIAQGLLAELVRELPWLRQPVAPGANPLLGDAARCMWQACADVVRAVPSQGDTAAVAAVAAAAAPGPAACDGLAPEPLFITPMAAVAGAVAQAVITAYQRPGITRAWVNNGGDIALHLAPGAMARIGLVADLARFDAATLALTQAGAHWPDGRFVVHAAEPVRGVATSGWRGRSFSLGIADSVTVLAASAAQADAAATVVANAVDLRLPGIGRAPASSLKDDSDLGQRLVTTDVPRLTPAQRQAALAVGLATAMRLQSRGLIHAAVLVCQGSLARLPALRPLQCQPELVQ